MARLAVQWLRQELIAKALRRVAWNREEMDRISIERRSDGNAKNGRETRRKGEEKVRDELALLCADKAGVGEALMCAGGASLRRAGTPTDDKSGLESEGNERMGHEMTRQRRAQL